MIAVLSMNPEILYLIFIQGNYLNILLKSDNQIVYRQSPDVPFALKLDNQFNLIRSKMDYQKPLVFYLHGFSEATTDDRWSGAQIKNG